MPGSRLRTRADTHLPARQVRRQGTQQGSYETDSSGRTVKVDKYGQRQWSEGGFQTDRDGRTYHVDKYSKEHSKGHHETDRSGRTVTVDKHGQKRWSERFRTDRDGATVGVDGYTARSSGARLRHGEAKSVVEVS